MHLSEVNYVTSAVAPRKSDHTVKISHDSIKNLPSKLAGETHINCHIEDFSQGGSKNCEFLARIKNLSRKSWGKKYIQNCIQPDGNGGAYINYLGSKVDQKIFHITKDEILEARNKQKKDAGITRDNKIISSAEFSSGDDDVLALEIASEKPIYYENEPIKLITGKTPISFEIKDQNIADNVLKKVNKNIDNYLVTISLKENNNIGLPCWHTIEFLGIEKDKNNNPMIRLCNPWDTSEEIVLNYYDVVTSLDSLYIAENPEKHLSWFENLCDDNTGSHKNETDLKAMQNFYTQKIVNKEFSAMQKLISLNDNQKRIQKINEYLENTDHVQINKMLKYKISDIITLMDKAEYGFGHGQKKKELISTLVEYISNEAWTKNVDYDIIQKFKKECYNELNSVLYVNEKNIIKAFEAIIPELYKVQSEKVRSTNTVQIVRIK